MLNKLERNVIKLRKELSLGYKIKGARPQLRALNQTVCHKCNEKLKLGDEVIIKTRGNRPRNRYHLKCAELVNLI